MKTSFSIALSFAFCLAIATTAFAQINNNTAYGEKALGMATDSTYTGFNTAVGYYALYNNRTTAIWNTSVGAYALTNNLTGFRNTALGRNALNMNTTGYYSMAIGARALAANTTGLRNTAVGDASLAFNLTGSSNFAGGDDAGYSNTTGSYNTFLGQSAGYTNQFGLYNTYLGYAAMPNNRNYSNAMALGAFASVTGSNMIVLGNSAVTSIRGQVNWTTLSDIRAKTNIRDHKLGLAFILLLRPRTYQYKSIDLETKKAKNASNRHPDDAAKDNDQFANPFAVQQDVTQYSGLIAQEVDAAAQALNENFSGVDKTGVENGGLMGLRYAEFTVPLIKAVQEMNEKIENLEKELMDLKANKQQNATGDKAELFQNAPNPFSQSTLIRYTLPNTTKQATLTIFDLTGKALKVYPAKAGNGQIIIEAQALAAGMYHYTLIADGKEVATKRMILIAY